MNMDIPKARSLISLRQSNKTNLHFNVLLDFIHPTTACDCRYKNPTRKLIGSRHGVNKRSAENQCAPKKKELNVLIHNKMLAASHYAL